jgi:hypothetical protein
MTEFGNYCYLGKTCFSFYATSNKTIGKGFSRNYFCNLEVDNWIDKYWKKFKKIKKRIFIKMYFSVLSAILSGVGSLLTAYILQRKKSKTIYVL